MWIESRAAGGIIMRVTYGYQVQSADDEFVRLAATTNANLTAALLTSSQSVVLHAIDEPN